MDHIGGKTPQATFLNAESHKLHLEFETDAVIHKGMPVKLTATGKIVPLAAGDSAHLCIGNSIHHRKANDLATVMMRGHAVLTVLSAGAINAGPVKWASYDEAQERSLYTSAGDAATTQGFALEDATAANQEITVVIN